ncbi:MAG: insulinase family protein [Armatimonadetes bacterium]|nr:insulinase family protein [Armatimonadota bacterium]
MILGCLVALFGFSSIAVADSTRLREVLPTGATVFAESLPGTKLVSLQIIGSARGAQDTKATHGYRHLLEHLMARGFKEDSDKKLEVEGLYLRATTFRDTMQFRVDCYPSQAPIVIAVFQDMLAGLRATPERILKESQIIREEIALISESRKQNREVWTQAYGDARLDPLGDPDLIATATPKSLADLQRTHFCGANLVVTVTGNVKVDEGILLAKRIAASAPTYPAAELNWMEFSTPKAARVSSGEMTTIGIPVGGFQEPKTVARAAAAFALAGLAQGNVSFMPTLKHGLVSVTMLQNEQTRAAFSNSPAAALEVGRLQLRRWMQKQISEPGRDGALRGSLLSFAPFYRPEGFLDGVQELKLAQFTEAWEEFRKLWAN